MSVVSYVVLKSLIGVVQGAATLVEYVLVILKHERLWVATGLVWVKLIVLGRGKKWDVHAGLKYIRLNAFR